MTVFARAANDKANGDMFGDLMNLLTGSLLCSELQCTEMRSQSTWYDNHGLTQFTASCHLSTSRVAFPPLDQEVCTSVHTRGSLSNRRITPRTLKVRLLRPWFKINWKLFETVWIFLTQKRTVNRPISSHDIITTVTNNIRNSKPQTSII